MNLSLIKHKIIRIHNYMSWSSSKLEWWAFGPTKGSPKYSRWGSEQVKNDMSVDRPVDRPTIIFQTIGVADQPPGRPRQGHSPIGRSLGLRSTVAKSREQCSLVGWLLGRPGPDPESNSLDQSTARSTGPRPLGLCTFWAHQSTARLTTRSPKSRF